MTPLPHWASSRDASAYKIISQNWISCRKSHLSGKMGLHHEPIWSNSALLLLTQHLYNYWLFSSYFIFIPVSLLNHRYYQYNGDWNVLNEIAPEYIACWIRFKILLRIFCQRQYKENIRFDLTGRDIISSMGNTVLIYLFKIKSNKEN